MGNYNSEIVNYLIENKGLTLIYNFKKMCNFIDESKFINLSRYFCDLYDIKYTMDGFYIFKNSLNNDYVVFSVNCSEKNGFMILSRKQLIDICKPENFNSITIHNEMFTQTTNLNQNQTNIQKYLFHFEDESLNQLVDEITYMGI